MPVTGVKNVVAKLEALKRSKQEIIDLVDDILTDVEIGATRDAPIGISQKIQKVATNGGLGGYISVNAGAIGAYIEFGTGQSAAQLVPQLPRDWQEIARKFYVNGQGRLIANPYLYPNWLRYTTGFRDKVKEILRKNTK